MEVKNEIYRYMKELVAIPSISNSREEQAAGEYIREELCLLYTSPSPRDS